MMRHADKGFSLVELLIVVAIAAILMSVAVPSFVDQLARRRVEGAANELISDLHYARTQAISKNKQVILTTHNTGASYTVNYVTSAVTPPLKDSLLPPNVSITADINVTFDPLRGMAIGAANIVISSTQTSATLRADTTAAGKIQLCSPSAAFGGYPTCS